MADQDVSGPAHFEHHEEAEVTWLELFYDLIFVAAIIQLGSFLGRNPTLAGVGRFAFLFVVIWVAWAGTAFFFNRWLADDVPLRLLVFVQIFTVGILAVLVGEAFGDASRAFAVAVAVLHAILVLLYVVVHRRRPRARRLTGRYATGFGVAATIWLASALVPEPYRFGIWFLALATTFYLALSPATRRLYPLLPLDVPRLSERFGQFTLIVIGESFIATVAGLTSEGLSAASLVFGAIAFVFIASVWWVYFQGIAGSVIREGASLAWTFWHVPMMLGIAAMGVGLRQVVLLDFDSTYDRPHRILLFGAVALCFVTAAILDRLGIRREVPSRTGKSIARAVPIAILVLLATLGLALPTGLALALGAAACLGQILIEILHHPDATTETRAIPAEHER